MLFFRALCVYADDSRAACQNPVSCQHFWTVLRAFERLYRSRDHDKQNYGLFMQIARVVVFTNTHRRKGFVVICFNTEHRTVIML